MTDKVWHAEGLGHESLANGDLVNGDHESDACVNDVSITRQQRAWVRPKDSPLKDPGLARANTAATHDHPSGTTADTWAKRHRHQTVLQQHCEFFDRDRDGILWPSDTYIGFHNLGFGVVLSLLALFIIHINFSYPTQRSWLPDPLFRIDLTNIHRTKHGSDSDVFDSQGRFRPQQFEDIFTKYADGAEYLTIWTLLAQIKGQRNVSDLIGWGGAVFEWMATYLMLWPEDGRMRKEDVRRVYDGSIFHGWARDVEQKRRKGEMRKW
ncbi:Caleosin-domain-containing protein [Didymella exigua CBS 183.55]|uniref:Caleosin-domain-containing protein n=1 Tax=Didymella exigua CBS 183.55 TaxID=1150837 RepID=A0A6A5REP7_9PLEO|nr:Caleosin-domain-containing protein [Didymella exigua CBS 183.55]KAF1925760.1 Caleosin-domain-containing protein [Didymella exigua CBS 183.55]